MNRRLSSVGLVGVCLTLLLFTTGCGGKKLECSLKEDDYEQTAYLKFDSKNNLNSGVLRQVMKFDEEEIAYLDDIKNVTERVKDNIAASESFSGLDFEVSDNGKDTIIVDFNFNAEEISQVLDEDLDDDLSYDAIREDLENDGFVCK